MADSTPDLEAQLQALRSKLEVQEQIVKVQAQKLNELEAAEERRTGRRGLFKLAGAAALGAAGSAVVAAGPAGAAPGDNFLLAGDNDGGSDETWMTSSSGVSTLEIDNTAGGYALTLSDAEVGTSSPLYVNIANPSNSSYGIVMTGYGSGISVGTVGAVGIEAQGFNYGASLFGGHAPLFLAPAGSPGSPTGGNHSLGEIYVDSNGVVYRCTLAGTPGSWVPLQATVPIASPERVVDTRHGTGGVTGPIAPGSSVHTTSNLTGGTVPSNAVGLTGNVTVTGINGALLNGYGVLTLFPAGEATPTAATITAGSGCFAISNAFVTNLGTGEALSFVWGGGGPVQDVQVIVDITSYIL